MSLEQLQSALDQQQPSSISAVDHALRRKSCTDHILLWVLRDLFGLSMLALPVCAIKTPQVT